MPHRLSLAVVALIVAWEPTAARTVAQDPQIHPPLPLVKRVKPISEASVFERPEIILEARVYERIEQWLAPDVCCQPVQFPVASRIVFAVEGWVLKVNERGSSDPDLSEGGIRFQIDPQNRVTWQPSLGARYVLWLDSHQYSSNPIQYATSHPQIGFEVGEDSDRVTPIIKGGDLDAYAGLTFDELVKVIQTGKPK